MRGCTRYLPKVVCHSSHRTSGESELWFVSQYLGHPLLLRAIVLRQNPVQFVLCVLNMALAQVPFWFAASAARCRPCELVHIGDDHVADLNGALEAGCRAILVTTPGATRHAFNSERVLGAVGRSALARGVLTRRSCRRCSPARQRALSRIRMRGVREGQLHTNKLLGFI